MTKSRDANYISAQDIPDLVSQLNFILQRMSDRIDKLEGIRASFASESEGEFGGSVAATSFGVSDRDDEKIHSMGE